MSGSCHGHLTKNVWMLEASGHGNFTIQLTVRNNQLTKIMDEVMDLTVSRKRVQSEPADTNIDAKRLHISITRIDEAALNKLPYIELKTNDGTVEKDNPDSQSQDFTPRGVPDIKF